MDTYRKKNLLDSVGILTVITISWIIFGFILSVPIKFMNFAVTGRHVGVIEAFLITQYTFYVFFAIIWLQDKWKKLLQLKT